MSIPATIAAIRKTLDELREDAAVQGAATAQVLHKLDEINRCLSVVATKVGHLHDSNARRAKDSRRRRK